MHRKHPKSFPQANLPILFNVVKRCKAVAPSMAPNTCFDFPLYSGGAPSSSPPPNPSNPTNNPRDSYLLYHNEHALVVNDPFHKSKFHCLVMPWDTKLKSLNDLDGSHVPLLQHMAAAGQTYIDHLKATRMRSSGEGVHRMMMGFHAIPSLPMLHLHCISLDLESDKLKKKQHYNSFATYYFLPFEAVLDDLKRNNTVTINQDAGALEAMVDGPMKCLWCSQPLSNMPEMKRHVPSCMMNMSRE